MLLMCPARRIRRALATAAVAAACLGVAGCGGDNEQELSGAVRTPPSQVGDVTLPAHDPDGSPQGDQPLRPDDGLLLVYFGFTQCPDICPTTMADLGAALEDLPPQERERIAVGMVTVDPGRDTGKVLGTYLGHFFPDSVVHAYRTTDRAQLAAAEEAFGASHRIGRPDAEGNYDVSHTAQLYAVDRTGTVLVEWPFGTQPEAIADDVRSLLART